MSILRLCSDCEMARFFFFFRGLGEIVVAMYRLSTLVCLAGALAVALNDLTVKNFLPVFLR